MNGERQDTRKYTFPSCSSRSLSLLKFHDPHLEESLLSGDRSLHEEISPPLQEQVLSVRSPFVEKSESRLCTV